MGYIYMLRNKINEKIYIGQTTRTIEIRFKAHQKSSGCVAIYNAIKFHGWENFEKDWYECPDEDLDFDEELLVREMETLAPNGYNLKEGGGTCKFSEESRQKMSKARRGEKHYLYGKTQTEETKQKMSDSTRGDKNHRSKRVYQYDLNDTLIDSFSSTGEAARRIGIYGSNIRACACGKIKTAYGFKWSYNTLLI